MAIKELRKASQPRDIAPEALTMALAILVDRIQSLPQVDKDDLYELMKGLLSAGTYEERDSIVLAMREVLDQEPVGLKSIDQESKFQPGEGVQKWIDYVSKRIRELRVEAGLTQEQLADKSGLPQSHISRLEGGKHSPSHPTLEKIAAALGVAISARDPSS